MADVHGDSNAVKKLMSLLFNVDVMKKTLNLFGVDTNEVSLEKLVPDDLKKASKILHNLKNAIAEKGSDRKLHSLSKDFYSLVPMKKEKSSDINDLAMFSEKFNVVKVLFNLEKAYSIFENCAGNLDNCMKKLKAEITTVKRDSSDYQIIEQYVRNTQVHKIKLNILEVFMVKRDAKQEGKESLKNRMLLWHGSKNTNYAGILSNGFKLASTEYGKFGPGIYFTDTVSKAANFCLPTASENVIILALCEVALGKMLKMKEVKPISEIPKGRNAILGLGKTLPDLDGVYKRKDGVIVPYAKPLRSNPSMKNILFESETGSLHFNEYVIHDENQINIQYLVMLRVE